MKNLLQKIIFLLIGIGLGIFLNKNNILFDDASEITDESVSNQKMENEQPLYWVAPMDPNYRRDKPGKSPMGMDLIPVYDEDEEEEVSRLTVKIPPEVVNNLGVRTTEVKKGTLLRKINTVGYLDYDETRISHIHTRTEGWIERLSVRAEGEKVRSNQLLFELYSPTLVNAQEEYLQALTAGNKLLIEASRERLFALGISKSQVDRLNKSKKVSQYIKFYAPQSGVLSRLNVREGMYIKPDTEVMSLANLDQVWLLAEVFERQATWVKTGQTARAKLPSHPGRVWDGEVDYIYPDLDPVTRTLRVRLKFDNPERLLMPNMYAHIEISGDPKPDVLSIPREALIRDANKTRVIIALGDGQYEAREIMAGMESDNSIEVISGLDENENIVISAQFLIDSEASLKASLHRISTPESEQDEMSMDEGHDHD